MSEGTADMDLLLMWTQTEDSKAITFPGHQAWKDFMQHKGGNKRDAA